MNETEFALEVAKLANELETIKIFGLGSLLLIIAIVFLVFMMTRSTRSQDKTNHSTVTGVFGITNKLIVTLENLDTTLRQLSTDFTRSVNSHEKMVGEQGILRQQQQLQNQRLNAFMTTMLDTNQMKAIMDRTDIPIPDMSEIDEEDK